MTLYRLQGGSNGRVTSRHGDGVDGRAEGVGLVDRLLGGLWRFGYVCWTRSPRLTHRTAFSDRGPCGAAEAEKDTVPDRRLCQG